MNLNYKLIFSNNRKFLEAGYAVVFFYRQHSLTPYHRKFEHGILDYVQLNGDKVEGIFLILNLNFSSFSSYSYSWWFLNWIFFFFFLLIVKPEYQQKLTEVAKKYEAAIKEKKLLMLPFNTVQDYLFYLRNFSQQLSVLKKNVIFYLAAAVSDFYIPNSKMVNLLLSFVFFFILKIIIINSSRLFIKFNQVMEIWVYLLIKFQSFWNI